jgi:hypothetical protein
MVVIVGAEIQGTVGGLWLPKMHGQSGADIWDIGFSHNATVTGGQYVTLDCCFTVSGGTDYITVDNSSNCTYVSLGYQLFVTVVQTA